MLIVFVLQLSFMILGTLVNLLQKVSRGYFSSCSSSGMTKHVHQLLYLALKYQPKTDLDQLYGWL